MTNDEARAAVVAALAQVAPEIDPMDADPTADMRDELGLDSLDFLGLVTDLAERTGVQVPESDYDQVRSYDGLVGYLVSHAS